MIRAKVVPHCEISARSFPLPRGRESRAVPIQPTPVDLWSTDSTLAMIARQGVSGLLVINRVTHRANLATEMIAVIRGLGCVAPEAQLGNRVGFAASMGKGSTVLEAVGELEKHVANAIQLYQLDRAKADRRKLHV